jgi:hypothetical protein
MSKCSWAGCSTGCQLPELKTEQCGVIGCDVQIHHACQTHWEWTQHKKDHPNDPDGSSCYECHVKRCMKHHPYSSAAYGLCSWADCSTGCQLPELKTKQCGVIGCDVQIHHACQTHWEWTQHKKEYPNDTEGLSRYECRLKRCMKHHPHYAQSSVVS